MTSTIKRTVSIISAAVLALMIGGYAAISGSEETGYTFCVNSKSKVVTYAKNDKCPKGSEGLLIGAKGATGAAGAPGTVGPAGATGPQGPKGDSPLSSYNLVLRDGSGAIVQGMVSDGVAIRNGYYWNLEYATGRFFPSNYLYEYYLNSNCTGEFVYPINTPNELGARDQYQSLLNSAKSNVLFMMTKFDGTMADVGPYTFTNDVALIDNRNFTPGSAVETWSAKTPVYFKNSYAGDICDTAYQPWFYIKGITKSSVQIPASLPAPVRWSNS